MERAPKGLVVPRAYAAAVIESVQGVAYGRPATNALDSLIREVQAVDPLAPVTVVVPSNSAGLAVRRVLGASRGLVNVAFVTPFGLAQHLGGARSAAAGQPPLTDPVLVAAIRVELRADAGFFAPVAFHAATETALALRYSELSRARPETLERLRRAGAPRTRALVDLFDRVRTCLASFSDEETLARHALAAVGAGDAVVLALGTVIVHLVQPLAPALTDLLVAVSGSARTRLIVGLTADAAADEPVRSQCERIGGEQTRESVATIATGTRILSASDVDEEVRAVLRELITIAASGVAFDRMAILMPTVEPYARTMHAQLDAAGIAYNGPAVRRLADTIAGRTLTRLVRMVDSKFARDEVVAFLAAVPLRTNGDRSVPVDHWDQISRRAGVVGGDDWRARLADYAAEMADRAETRERAGGGGVAGLRRDASAAAELAGFVAEVQTRLHDLESTDGWGPRAAVAQAVLGALLGPPDTREQWPTEEHDAYASVIAALGRLAALDAIEPGSPFGAFARALDTELDVPIGRIGRFGRGVLCASIGTGLGLDLDAVFIVGLAEGLCPAARREDALLSDTDRALAVEHELPVRALSLEEQRREFLAALAAGGRHRVLSYPRGDLRSGRERLPSRWLLETASALAARRVFASDFATLDHDSGVRATASFASGLREWTDAPSLIEHDLGLLAAFVAGGGDVATHGLVAGSAVAAGVDATRSRIETAFSRWDGNVNAVRDCVATPGAGEVVSATRLEGWAQCPFSYLLKHVLRVAVEEDPERLLELSPRVRGTLVHEILELFVTEELAKPEVDRVPAGAPWPEDSGRQLVALLDRVGAAAEERGLTGKAALWALHREEIAADLWRFLEEDSGYRMRTGAVPESVELAFGFDGAPPVTITTPSGRAVRFRGRADRIDRLPDGSITVLDYKTGRPKQYDGLDDDPVKAGLRLQLPVYAAAARQMRGSTPENGAVAAAYWYVSTRGGFAREQVALDAATSERFGVVVDHIADGIDAGTFPAVPGEWSAFFGRSTNCRWCEYDGLCAADRIGQWETKVDAPELAPFHSLVRVPTEVDEP